MSKNQRIRQRVQRKEKAQIKAALTVQNQIVKNITPASDFKALNKSFYDFAIDETRHDIQDKTVEQHRVPTLEKAMELGTRINKSRTKSPSSRIQVLYSGFEQGR